jgi:hypothetical protein
MLKLLMPTRAVLIVTLAIVGGIYLSIYVSDSIQTRVMVHYNEPAVIDTLFDFFTNYETTMNGKELKFAPIPLWAIDFLVKLVVSYVLACLLLYCLAQEPSNQSVQEDAGRRRRP